MGGSAEVSRPGELPLVLSRGGRKPPSLEPGGSRALLIIRGTKDTPGLQHPHKVLGEHRGAVGEDKADGAAEMGGTHRRGRIPPRNEASTTQSCFPPSKLAGKIKDN